MELLSFLNLDELALVMSQMSMYPLFESAHYIVSVMSLKEQPAAYSDSSSTCLSMLPSHDNWSSLRVPSHSGMLPMSHSGTSGSSSRSAHASPPPPAPMLSLGPPSSLLFSPIPTSSPVSASSHLVNSQYPSLWSMSSSSLTPVSQSSGMSNSLGSQFLRSSTTHYPGLSHAATCPSQAPRCMTALPHRKFMKPHRAVEVACRSPVACWFSSMLYCFGGAILSAVLLAEPPVEPFSDNSHVLVASLIWYLMFYCPQDLVYSCASLLPVRLVLSGMKEVTRTWKVLGGVVQAQKKYQNSLLVMIAVGWAKGSGHGLISNFEQLVRGVWRPETNELLKMSYATKVTLIGAVVFTLQQSHILPVQKHQLMFLYTLFLVINKVRMMLTAPASPFAPVETAIYRVLFGTESTHPPSANEAGVSVTSPSETCAAAAEAIKPATLRHNDSVCCDAEQNAAPSAEAAVAHSLQPAAGDVQQTAAGWIKTD